MTGDEARLGHLNLVEFTRQDCSWQSPHEVLDDDGVLLFAGASDFPAYNNGVYRIDDAVPGEEVVARARRFFADRARGFSLWARDLPVDDDLHAAFAAAVYGRLHESPQMVCRARLTDVPVPDGVAIRRVVDAAGVAEYAEVSAAAYASLGSPPAATHSHFGRPGALLEPHVHAVIAYLDATPASAALSLLSHGVGGVYWVGTVDTARGRGLAEACTRVVTNAAFDAGAAAVHLQASPMGEPIYRRMGYVELYRYAFYLAGPPT